MEAIVDHLSLKDDLAAARAEEAEARRRAARLQITGAASDLLRDALREVEHQRARVARLQQKLRQALAGA